MYSTRSLFLQAKYLAVSLNLRGVMRMSTGVPIDFKGLSEHRCLTMEKFGEPKDVISLKVSEPNKVLPKTIGPKQVFVEYLASCINPADINLIQGVYGIKPELPVIPGGEGVVRVRQVGSDVSHLKEGDFAISMRFLNHWQTYSVQDSESYYKVDNKLRVEEAAQLRVNPCTAYRMIKDFYPLQKGDVIIQNGANSAVGVYVIQLAKLWGFKTMNVIRDRPNKEEVVKELKDFGADIVLTEEEVSNVEVVKPILKDIGKPKIFLNCVGGKNAMNCQRSLADGGYSITYGAMSRQPFSLAATSLIFKDHKYVGFWVSRWFSEREKANQRSEINGMFDEIVDMFKSGTLRSKSTTLIDFEDRDLAFGGSNNTKYLFSINK